jgi:probable HAF family extracellular repeat protein
MKKKEAKKIGCVFALGLGLTLFAVCASAQREPSTRHYTIADLGTLGGSSSSALAINNEGQVVGRSTLPGDMVTGAFLWQDGMMTDLGSLGGTFSTANGINRAGDVVGASELPNNTARHAVLFRNGQIMDLGALPQSRLCAAFGVNDRGNIFGGCIPVGRVGPFHATQYKDGTVIDLGTLGGPSSFTNTVNERGTAAGRADLPDGSSRAVIFTEDAFLNLGTLPGGNFSAGRAINDRGEVACISNIASGDFHACLYDRGDLVDLGTLGGSFSDSGGINNRGQIVGNSTTAAGQQHAYLWSKGGIADLNCLIPAGSGWVLMTATGISSEGLIVGNGLITGHPHAYLLIPVDSDDFREED